MNRWRSPTAENVYRSNRLVSVRSCGTNSRAVRTIKSSDIKWADMVLVMEQKHASRIRCDFPGEMRFTELHVLDIPDDYRYMEPELVAEIVAVVDPLIGPEN